MASPELSRRRSLVALALTSAVAVAHEVLVTRLLSVVTWYGLGFFVLSIAMLGMPAGALRAFRARETNAPVGPWLSRHAVALAFAIALSLLVVLAVPMVSDPSATA